METNPARGDVSRTSARRLRLSSLFSDQKQHLDTKHGKISHGSWWVGCCCFWKPHESLLGEANRDKPSAELKCDDSPPPHGEAVNANRLQ